MSNDEIEKLLNSVDKNITNLTKKAYDKLIKMIDDGLSPQEAKKQIRDALATINDGSADVVAESLNTFLAGTVTAEYVKDFEVHGTKLSKRLYANARDVELKSMKVINDALKQKKTVDEISKLLYEGYNFKEDPLNVKRKSTIPKWLKDELNKPPSQRSFKQVGTIKTKALKAAYTQALKEESAEQLNKQLDRAFYEKSRYYANRIAQNEVMKSYSVERAKMIRDDDDIEVVKVRMSKTHDRVDICDYHTGVNKYGLGKGVYPKEKAPIPPFHPWCRCRIVEDITKSSKDAEIDPKADKKVMQKFSLYEQSLILGSQKRRDAFLRSPKDVLEASYIGKPMYIDEVDRVKYVGYNAGMQKFYEKFKRNKFGFEIGDISIVLANILNSKTKTVTMSNETLTKNLKHHPDLKESDYLLLDDIVGKSHFVAKDGDRTVAIVLNQSNKELYHYALKSTVSGKGLFLTSFRKTNKISIDKIRKKSKENKVKILKDNLP